MLDVVEDEPPLPLLLPPESTMAGGGVELVVVLNDFKNASL